ncbi:MAG: PEP-CTERM sorting domain-containing protein [Lentisphaeria bacterium]
MKRNATTWGLIFLAGMSVGAAVVTNNKTDWNGVTNTTTGGRWSYLNIDTFNSTATSVGLLGQQYGTAQDNWCVDKNNANYVWYVASNGCVMTDGRALGWAYTNTVNSGDASVVTISGSYGNGAAGWNFAIYVTSDTDLDRIDMSTKTLLYSWSTAWNESATVNFNLTTALNPGNDIVFVANINDYWWEPRYLDATIMIVPEPAALSLLALGGLVLFRRR